MLKIDTIVEGIPDRKPDKITREQLHEMLDAFIDVCEAGNCGTYRVYDFRGEFCPEFRIQRGVDVDIDAEDISDSTMPIAKRTFSEVLDNLLSIKNAPEAATSQGK